MNNYYSSFLAILLSFCSLCAYSGNLSDDAKNRGINQTCSNYLSQVEELYNLNGLNLTFAHPENPSSFPSLHISSQQYNNGSSSFSATLSPDGEYCYISTIVVTAINDQSCSDIAQTKSESENLKLSEYAEGAFIILTPSDSSYQTVLTSSSNNSCTMTEARIMWPGK